jgi:hypothetical protein
MKDFVVAAKQKKKLEAEASLKAKRAETKERRKTESDGRKQSIKKSQAR